MNIQAIFLGIADHHEMNGYPYPYGNLDIFGLSKYKKYLFYPWELRTSLWVFLLHTSILEDLEIYPLSISINHENGTHLDHLDFNQAPRQEKSLLRSKNYNRDLVIMGPMDDHWQLVTCQFDSVVPFPGKYTLTAKYKDTESQIGQLIFIYEKTAPFQLEQARALEADPFSIKHAKIILGCKSCYYQYIAYTALDRARELEEKGWIWQHDLPNEISCTCGKTKHDLKYVRESMHAILGRRDLGVVGDRNYHRRYSHLRILQIADDYLSELELRDDENSIQRFLERNTVLLYQFHATRLFVKPNILGKYEADFAILDTNKKLLFIEIERPAIKLFKKDGHPTAELMHAYGQVRDWLNEYQVHRPTILESLDLKSEEVLRVAGVVIAGDSRRTAEKHLFRHMMTPLYNDIEFMTLDQLGVSLVQLSRELA